MRYAQEAAMSRYKMEDGTVIDTKNASAEWDDKSEFDGRNMISIATGSQWRDATLYRSRKGRYYVEHRSRVQGEHDHAEWVSPQEAARWLLAQSIELPDDLKKFEAEIVE